MRLGAGCALFNGARRTIFHTMGHDAVSFAALSLVEGLIGVRRGYVEGNVAGDFRQADGHRDLDALTTSAERHRFALVKARAAQINPWRQRCFDADFNG